MLTRAKRQATDEIGLPSCRNQIDRLWQTPNGDTAKAKGFGGEGEYNEKRTFTMATYTKDAVYIARHKGQN